jgi:hypothetical protein
MPVTKHTIKTWTWYGMWLAVYGVLGLWALSGAFLLTTGISLWLLAEVGNLPVHDLRETLLRIGLLVFLACTVVFLPLVLVAIFYSGWAGLEDEEEGETAA